MGCVKSKKGDGMKIIFLHHSTGELIWKGGVKEWFKKYNKENSTNYKIEEQAFPKTSPYGWNNYPYDYWNIWVENAGGKPFMSEPTLEILTKKYDIIIWNKNIALIFFGSRTGQAISLGIGIKIIHYFLIGIASFLSGTLTYLRRRGKV